MNGELIVEIKQANWAYVELYAFVKQLFMYLVP